MSSGAHSAESINFFRSWTIGGDLPLVPSGNKSNQSTVLLIGEYTADLASAWSADVVRSTPYSRLQCHKIIWKLIWIISRLPNRHASGREHTYVVQHRKTTQTLNFMHTMIWLRTNCKVSQVIMHCHEPAQCEWRTLWDHLNYLIFNIWGVRVRELESQAQSATEYVWKKPIFYMLYYRCQTRWQVPWQAWGIRWISWWFGPATDTMHR